MKYTVQKIVSGGQTGADTGALIAARDLGVSTGGHAPRGFLTENGCRRDYLKSFGLSECSEGDSFAEKYRARTKMNIIDSDGTLIIGDPNSPGSKLTHNTTLTEKKPLATFYFTSLENTKNVDWTQKIAQVAQWMIDNKIQILNVAGNRESKQPGIQDMVMRFVHELIVTHTQMTEEVDKNGN